MTEHIDTGFDDVYAGNVFKAPEEVAAPMATPPVTATVTQGPPPPGLTPAGVQASKALVHLPATLDAVTMAKLAREIAMDIKEQFLILKEFNLTQAQYDHLEENNDFFKNALSAAVIEWHSPLSTVERVKLQSAAILEECLPSIGARMQNKAEGLPGVVEAAKFFAKNAGIGERDVSGASAGERFTINIDLGGDQKITVSTAAEAQPDFGGTQTGSLSADAEAKGGTLSIRQEPERAGEPSSLPPFPKGP